MIDKLIAFSLRQKVLVYALVLTIIGLGLWSAFSLPVDAVPDITNNQVLVITHAPALPATEVEQLVTTPIEANLAQLPGLEELRSISRPGLSVITLVFTDATPVTTARQLVSEQLKTAEGSLPAGTSPPELGPIATGLGEVYQYVLEVDSAFRKVYSLDYLRTLQDWHVRRLFAGTPGVIEVNSLGGHEREVEVTADARVLASFNLTLRDVEYALMANNSNQGSAYIEKGPSRYYLGTRGRFVTMDQVAQTYLKHVNGVPLTIADVASVRDGAAPRFGSMSRNGEGEVVGGILMLLKGASSSQTITHIEARVRQINRTLPPGIRIVPFLNRADFIGRVIGTVRTNLIEGGLIVLGVLILFLGSWRSGIIVATVIPLSLLFAFICMRQLGIVANLMSLGAIDFGLVVDGSLIIVESVVAHLTPPGLGQRRTREEMDGLVYESASRIRTSAAFGELIILVVYVPVLLLSGVEGKTFQPLAATVCFALLGAFLLSLTWIPVACSLFLRNSSGESPFAERLLHRMQATYLRLLKGALRHQRLVMAAAVVALAGALVWVTQAGGEFLPQLDEGDFALELRLAPGSSLNETLRTSAIIERKLKSVSEVKAVVSKIGTSSIPTDPMPPEANDMMVLLDHKQPWTRSKAAIQEELEGILDSVPGIRVEFLQPIQMRFNELMSGVKGDIAIMIYGDSLPRLAHLANRVAQLAGTVPGAADVKVEPILTHPQFSFVFDRSALARYGCTVTDANAVIEAANAGLHAGEMFEGMRRFLLMVRTDSATRNDTNAINRLLVPSSAMGTVPLGQLGNWHQEYLPQQISHEKSRRRVAISLNVRGSTVQEVVTGVRQKLAANLPLPSGYTVEYGGQFENFENARRSLALAVPLALLGIFCLLFISFSSVKQALLIMICVPLAGVGGVIALALRGMPFSISAGVGFIALFGVAVINGMVLLASLNHLQHTHYLLPRRIMEACLQRVRPVLMTAVVASLGFIPMAFSSSSGAEVQRPLATVIVGGLPVATLLTLVVLPILYLWLERNGWRRKAKTTGLMALAFVLTTAAQGQTPANQTQATVSALEQKLVAHPLLQAKDKQLEALQFFRKTSFNPGKTQVDYSVGQTQAVNTDYTVLVQQPLHWPGVYGAQRNDWNNRIALLETERTLLRAELRHRLTSLVYDYAVARQRVALLTRQDSLLSRAEAAAQARVQVGETAPTYLTTISLRRNEVRMHLAAAESQLGIYLQQLTLLTGETRSSLTVDQVVLPLLSQGQAPQVLVAQQRSQLAQGLVRLARNHARPDFLVGYANQSVEGRRGLQYVTAGISVPLALNQYRYATKALEQETEAAKALAGYTATDIATQLASLTRQREALLTNLQLLQQTSLPLAEANFRRFQGALRAGNFDFSDFVLHVLTTFETHALYFQTLEQLNATTNQINLLHGSYN